MIKLSVAIITYNEENNIERCISSVKPLADEIVVVDSFSTDRTESICHNLDVTFIQNKFEGHIEQKNFALDKCKHDYILSLDADEVLSTELLNSIKKLKKNWKGNGYRFNRLTNYVGHWVRYCGWYPDIKLRLIKKGSARWRGNNPHDILVLDNGERGNFIGGDLLHYSYNSISEHISQTNNFTTIAARNAFEKGVRSHLFKIVGRTFYKFSHDYFIKKGFLDGYYGIVICYINALSAFLKYSKIKELQDGKKI